ncbi:pectate lyase [Chryseobacterium daeguense]|uniref:pectate lyase n=1 Tax=Chryseobacterium daeguense TaxID=412438 RepID=UPI0004006512|nr:pectate lyase [Chryseobacterium daeguense]
MKIKIYSLAFGLVTIAASAQVKDSIAEKMLLYQLPNGGWGKHTSDKKNVDYTLPVDQKLMKIIKAGNNDLATIDNNATSKEINGLIHSYQSTKNPEYLKSAEKGIEYLLSMQYENGGFPQYFPNSAIYRKQITYNDNAMINALTVLYNVAEGKNGFEAVDLKLKERSKTAVQKGIQCILKTQVVQNGNPAIWADQYNEITLQPDKARAFEPISLATGESVGIVRFLMMQPVTPEIEKSVKSAVNWFKQNKIEGYSYSVSKVNGKAVRTLKEEKNSVIWARFYDIKTNKPIFGDRDGSVKYNYNEVSEERRNGYSWYGDFAEKLINKEYPKWIEKNKIGS